MPDTQVAAHVAQHAGFVESFVQNWAVFVKAMILPTLLVMFTVGVFLRGLIYYTVKRNEWFAREFEKRMNKAVDAEGFQPSASFYVTVKSLLEKTYYELFEVRSIMRRRKLDYVMSPADRLFLIQAGSAFLVKDTLRHVRFLRYGGERPRFVEVSKTIFQNNPCFTNVLGVVPAAPLNDALNVLPSLFIIGGIFGTFLGILKALPELTGMDLTNIEVTKATMDGFLTRLSFSMAASVVGIFLSVAMTMINTFLNPERIFVEVVNRFEYTLEYLWHRCETNEIPQNIPGFDENRDAIDALAEYAVEQEVAKHHEKVRKLTETKPVSDAVHQTAQKMMLAKGVMGGAVQPPKAGPTLPPGMPPKKDGSGNGNVA